MRIARGLPWTLVVEGFFWMAVRRVRNAWNQHVRYREFPTAICDWCGSWDFEVAMRAIADEDGSEPLLCASCLEWRPTMERIRDHIRAKIGRSVSAAAFAVPVVEPVTWRFAIWLAVAAIAVFVALWFAERKRDVRENRTAFDRYLQRAQRQRPGRSMPTPNRAMRPEALPNDSAPSRVSQ